MLVLLWTYQLNGVISLAKQMYQLRQGERYTVNLRWPSLCDHRNSHRGELRFKGF